MQSKMIDDVAAGMVSRGRDGGGKKKCKMVEVQGRAESGSVWYVGLGDKSKGWQRECHAAGHDGKEGNASIGVGHQVAVAVISSRGGKNGVRDGKPEATTEMQHEAGVTAGTGEKEEDREEKEKEKEKET